MGGGNGQKAAFARSRNEKKKKPQGKESSQRAINAAACNIICQVCRQSFMNVSNDAILMTHVMNRHQKKAPADCFPGRLR
ncbi:unnamed protein product [Choristocarpus tenellus]